MALATAAQAQVASASDTVVITANRLPQPLSSVLADVSVIERAQIERSGAVGVADLLARLPGVELARNGGVGATTSVFIRGAELRHVAVYVDGMRIDSQSTGGAVWEQIPLDQIERIEVLRGPAAAVYGSDAMGGVVQLFTRRGNAAPGTTSSAALTVGTRRTWQAQAGLSGATERIDYALSASKGASRGFNARLGDNINPDDDGWRRQSVTLRGGWQIDGVHRLEASLLHSTLDARYDGFDPAVDDWSHHRLRSTGLTWRARWSEQASTRVQLSRSDSDYASQPDGYRSDTTLHNLVLMHEQRIAEGQWLTATLERRDDELYNPADAWTPALAGRRHQNALALGWRADVAPWGWQAHLRHDDDSEFGAKTTGSAAVGWRFAPHWRATAGAATSFRVPTLYQRFSQYGNAALRPESGHNVELGLRWERGADTLSLNAWRNRLSNLIGFGAAGACASAYGCFENANRALLKGLTLAGATELDSAPGPIRLHAALDWHSPRNDATGALLPRRAQRLARMGAQLRHGAWTLGSDLQAASRRFDDAANTRPMGGYAVVDLWAELQLAPGLQLQGRIDNLGDRPYQTAKGYPADGRSVALTLRWAER